MPRGKRSHPKTLTRVPKPDGQLAIVSLTSFGLSEAEIQKLTPFARLTLRNMLDAMPLTEEKRVLMRNALSPLLEAMQQSVNLQELAMAILRAENRFSEEIRADMLQLASLLHRLA